MSAAQELVVKLRLFADELDGPLECKWPAYGVPGHAHCAACCYGTGRIITCDSDQALADAADALRHAALVIDEVVAALPRRCGACVMTAQTAAGTITAGKLRPSQQIVLYGGPVT